MPHEIDLPERNPAFHSIGVDFMPSSDGGIFDFLNSVAAGIGSVGTNVYNSLAGIKQAELQYGAVGKPTQTDKNMQYLLIGGGILLLVVLLKD